MLLKYTDLHNKILRDAADPDKVADELIENGYYIVGVNAHNDGDEISNKEHFYKFFESHFEMFENKGLLMLPSVELKIRDNNYEKLSELIKEFSRKFIPIHHKGEIHHVHFLIMVHGGMKGANIAATKDKGINILCHPEKDEGYITQEIFDDAAKNDIGIEINYREYNTSEDKDSHVEKIKEMLKDIKKSGCKLFLCSASIREEELIHIKELIDFGKLVHEDLIHESIENTYALVKEKYSPLFEKIEFSLDKIKEKHKKHL